MSKIAEKRTDEIVGEYHDGDYTDHSRHNTQWVAFKQGYDQAMQDFLEKAERYLKNKLYDRVEIEVYGTIIPDIIDRKGFIENFKNYMQDEN